VRETFIELSSSRRHPVKKRPHNEAFRNSTRAIVMQTTKPSRSWQDFPINLLYSAFGLAALSLLVAWSVELLAETLFLKW
jgi:hypothetical protein